MHPLIERAKNQIRGWSSGRPADLARDVARLCRDILDDGGLPEHDRDWQRLRRAFDVAEGESLAAAVARWDDLCRFGDFDISNRDLLVKLGIVNWTVKELLLKVGMLGESNRDLGLEPWKASLIDCLDRYILSPKKPTPPPGS